MMEIVGARKKKNPARVKT